MAITFDQALAMSDQVKKEFQVYGTIHFLSVIKEGDDYGFNVVYVAGTMLPTPLRACIDGVFVRTSVVTEEREMKLGH